MRKSPSVQGLSAKNHSSPSHCTGETPPSSILSSSSKLKSKLELVSGFRFNQVGFRSPGFGFQRRNRFVLFKNVKIRVVVISDNNHPPVPRCNTKSDLKYIRVIVGILLPLSVTRSILILT